VVRDFCLGETFAVPLFAAMRERARHPVVAPALVRILADEAIHRQFGWDALDALLAREGDGEGDAVRRHVEARLGGWLDGVRDAYAPEPPGAPGPPAAPECGDAPPLTDAELDAGLLPLERYRAVFWDTVRGDLRRRFAARGIALPAGYADGG
jgi:hypothetical protein